MQKSIQIFTIIKYQKEDSQFIFLSVVLINSVFRADKNYYPGEFVDECNYLVKEKMMPECITDDIEFFF